MIRIRPYNHAVKRRQANEAPDDREAKEKGPFEVDIIIHLPDGTRLRDRKRSPVPSRSGTLAWAQRREQELYKKALAPKPTPEPEKPKVQTLAEFWPRFLRDHVDANDHKPSGRESKLYGYRCFLEPRFGNTPLDEITDEMVDSLKTWMREEKGIKGTGTINNTLSLLSIVLKMAVRWRIIEVVPCRIIRLRKHKPLPKFYTSEQLDRLLRAARELGPRYELLILLGADAGLRAGEIQALERSACDVERGQLRIEWAISKGKKVRTKGMADRAVPMTARLRKAIEAYPENEDTDLLLVGGRPAHHAQNSSRVVPQGPRGGQAQGQRGVAHLEAHLL